MFAQLRKAKPLALKRQVRFISALLIFTLFGILNNVQAATKGKRNLQQSHFDAMLSKANNQGKLAVIIEYKATKPIKKQALSRAQRQERYNSEFALLRKLSKFKPKRIKRFNHSAMIAMQLSAEGLEMAMHDPQVQRVYEDKLSRLTLQTSSPLVGATAAADAGFSGQGQTIAILDTGVDKTHPFLAGKVVHEACFSQTINSLGSTSVCPNNASRQIGSGSGVPCSLSDCDHGTHVAGIAAGKGNNFSGVAKDANIISIQVFSRLTGPLCDGASPCIAAFTSDQLLALEHVYSLRNNFNISSVNLSLGINKFTSACDSDPRKGIIDLLRTAGIATVIASGNDGYTNAISSPSCISSAIAVGSTTKQDVVSDFSNSASLLDLLAPGSFILSSIPGNSYAFFSGTSMATPHVSGAFAVIKSRFPSLSVTQIKRALKATGKDIVDSRNGLHKPRIRIAEALSFIASLASNNTTKIKTKDFNGDGKSDILWRNRLTGENYLYHLQGTALLASKAINTVSDLNWKIVGVGDFNADGNSDILWRHATLGTNWIYLMNDNIIQSHGRLNQVADLHWNVVGIGDFNNDNKSDVLWRNNATGHNWIYLMDGLTIQSQGLLNHVPDLNWQVAGIGDFNNDSKSDILWRHRSVGINWIYLMNGLFIQSQGSIGSVPDQNWQIQGVGDFNADAKSDILWRHATSGRNHLYFMNNINLDSQAQINIVANQNWKVESVGDYNADGSADIFWRNASTGENYVYFMDENLIIGRGTVNRVPNLNWEIQP